MGPRRILYALSMATLFICAAAGSSATARQTDQSWTIMVYMANDTSGTLPSVDNINSMEAAPAVPGTTVVVLRDEAGDGDSSILRIEHDSNLDQEPIISTVIDDGDEVIGASNEVNMADPATLSDFISFSAAAWPADRYVLILWGHGAGWNGLCLDRTDILNLTELKLALDSGCASLGRPLDMIAVDACVEATLETIFQIREYADYFVSAETSVPYQGLPYYDILTGLSESPNQSVGDFGKLIIDEYIGWSAIYSQNSATMASFRLDGVGALVDSLVNLSELGLRYDALFHDKVRSVMAQSESHGTEWVFDVGDFLKRLSGADLPLEVRVAATASFMAYSNMIGDFGRFRHPDPIDEIEIANSTGAVVYASSTSPFDAQYSELDLAHTRWHDFAVQTRLVAPTIEGATGPQITYADSDADGLHDEATLTWDAPYYLVSACVFRQSSAGLTLIDYLQSGTGTIVLSGISGEFLVAAGAGNESSMLSYVELSVTLFGFTAITIELLRDGKTVTDATEEFDIRAVSNNLMVYGVDGGSTFTVKLAIPTQVTVGQLIELEVLDADGATVATEHVFVPQGGCLVSIELPPDNAPDKSDFNVLLLFSILPGLFVLAFALMLYMDFRKLNKKV